VIIYTIGVKDGYIVALHFFFLLPVMPTNDKPAPTRPLHEAGREGTLDVVTTTALASGRLAAVLGCHIPPPSHRDMYSHTTQLFGMGVKFAF
jgi:hypothetical protein